MREYREVRVTSERRLPGETLVEHAAERVDIGTPVDLTGDLLGCDVIDGAHEVAVVADSGFLETRSEAEVREVDVVGAVGAGAGSRSTLEGFTSRCTRPRA